MSGKHGRPRPGRSSEPGNVTIAPNHPEPTPPAAPAAPGAPIAREVYLPPEVRAAPLPPSLPPIRSTPLPGFTIPEFATPELATPELATPDLSVTVVETEELPPAPIAPAVYETPPPPAVPASVPAPAIPASVPAPIVHTTPPNSVGILPMVLPGPADPILPSDRPTAREEAHGERARRRRFVLMIVAGVALLGLLGYWVMSPSGSTTATKAPPVQTGRSQETMLIQFSGSLGSAVGSALVAHDTVAHDGVVVLVPSDVIAQVPGFGSMPFGQALTVGDPTAPRTALSDLIGVSVDSSWTLTPTAFAALIDKVGGVTLVVNRDVTKTAAGVTSIIVPAGQQKLAGTAAVAYASFLAPGETEQARLARFDSVFRQVLTALPHDQGTLSTQLASLGKGSASSLTVTNLAAFLHNLAGDSAQKSLSDQLLPVIDLQAGGDQPAYTLDTANAAALVKAQLASSVPANRKVTGNRVYVQNQVGTPGLGESTRAKLQRAGYLYIHGENTQDMPNAQSQSAVVIFGQTAAQIAEGQAVATALGLPASDVKISSEGFTVADVVVKLGVDYKQ